VSFSRVARLSALSNNAAFSYQQHTRGSFPGCLLSRLCNAHETVVNGRKQRSGLGGLLTARSGESVSLSDRREGVVGDEWEGRMISQRQRGGQGTRLLLSLDQECCSLQPVVDG
jgi:hypothetical protein